MYDREYREQGKNAWDRAEKTLFKYLSKKIDLYIEAVEWYNKIEDKSPDDIDELSKVCRETAMELFNKGALDKLWESYDKSRQYYETSIHWQCQLPHLTDNQYRMMIRNFLDLGDAYIRMMNEQSAYQCNQKAIEIFPRIVNKTQKELKLGNPAENFQAFHNHYEAGSSTTDFLDSTSFKNDQRLFFMNNEKVQDNQLADSIAKLDIHSKKMDDELIHMFNQLSVTQQFSTPNCNVVVDNECRTLAMKYLQIVRIHLTTGIIKDICITLDQASDALNKIKDKTASDLDIIKTIQNQKQSLNKPADKQVAIHSIFQQNNNLLQQKGMEVDYETSMDLD